MKWIEAVKEALQLCGEELDLLHEVLTDFPYYYEPDDKARALEHAATKAYKKAVALIPEEPEMMTLLRHIRAEHSFHSQRALAFYKARKWAKRHFERGLMIMCSELVVYIEQEFGYKLEDEK